MLIHIEKTAEESAQSAARGIARSIRAAVHARGTCILALSGGRSSEPLLAALATERIPWQSVHVVQVDERVAPADDIHRNWERVRTILLGKIAVPSSNLHPISLDTGDPGLAARNYAATLIAVAGQPPVIDLVHLGLGQDGHTASLVPDDPVLEQLTDDVAVTREYEGYRRITLTYPCLRRARQIIWFITGSSKATALQRLQGEDSTIPAGRLRHDRNVVYVDRAAAAKLSECTKTGILTIDVGGSHVKFMDSVSRERRQFDSGSSLTPKEMLSQLRSMTADWEYGAISIGIPGPVRNNRPTAKPPNLGDGWVGFDYAGAFGKPLKIMNDAALQALGSYRGGGMLFLGLGTGLGSALISDDRIVPMELAHLPYRNNKTFEDYVGERGLDRLGKRKWRKHVGKVIGLLRAALLPDEVVLGGGNVRLLDELPDGCRRGNNNDAFLGGFRLWQGNHEQCDTPGSPARSEARHRLDAQR